MLVHMQHDPGRLIAILGEEALQHMDDKLHRRVVIIQQQNLVHTRFFRLRPRDDDGFAIPIGRAAAWRRRARIAGPG